MMRAPNIVILQMPSNFDSYFVRLCTCTHYYT